MYKNIATGIHYYTGTDTLLCGPWMCLLPPPSLTHACGGPIGIFFFLKDIAIKLFGCTRFLFFYFCVFWRPGLKALFLNQFYSYCSGSDGLARYYALIASFIYYPCKN